MKPIVMNKETIDLKLLRYFVEVADVLNFTQASAALKIPKSALSKGIAKLESQIGEKLFERSSRVVTLTDTGEILHQRASHLLDESNHLLHDLKSLKKRVAGLITLSAPPVLGRFLSHSIIPSFMLQWPDVSFSLQLSYEYENLFTEGIDLAFRMGKNRDENVIERAIGFSNRIVVASPDYLNGKSPIIEPKQLSDHTSAHFFVRRNQTPWILKKGNTTEQVDVPAGFQCEDLNAVANAVTAGIGLAQLPWLVVRDAVKQGRLVHVLPEWSSPKLPISLVYRQGHNKPARLNEFLSWVEQNKGMFDLCFHPTK